MKYRIDQNIIKVSEDSGPFDHAIVEVITSGEYREKYKDHPHNPFFLRSIENFQYCKADLFRECIVGTFVIPDKEKLLEEGKEKCFAYYLDREHLIFVDDSDTVNNVIHGMRTVETMVQTQTAHFLFEFLEYLVRDDILFLQGYEKRMANLEESLLEEQDDNTPRIILAIRKELLRLNSYYSQLIDMSNTINENFNHILNEEDCALFMLFSDRVSRLSEDTKMLREMALQILEMYQTQLDLKQNDVMQFLTVVTTIFTPLAFLSGWYGMNFVNIPELRSPIGYFILVGVAILITLICLLYFKKVKWIGNKRKKERRK